MTSPSWSGPASWAAPGSSQRGLASTMTAGPSTAAHTAASLQAARGTSASTWFCMGGDNYRCGHCSSFNLPVRLCCGVQWVFLSHHLDKSIAHMFPSNVIEKPDVTSLTETGANFKDGTFCEVDEICYCTGYVYSFPFLTPDCGVQVEEEEVHPLFMQVVSVERPTLAFIGLPFIVCPFALFDMQSRFLVAVLDGRCRLPDTDALRRDAEAERRRRREEGLRPHYLGNEQLPYLHRLADLAAAPRLPNVLFRLFDAVLYRMLEDLPNYRRRNFRIIDSETFQEVA